jgi:Beta-lactamase
VWVVPRHGHRWLFGVLDPQDERYNTSQLPSGFLIASAEDMTHFLVAQQDGGRYEDASVLSPAGIAAMQAPGVPTGARGERYGLGWKRARLGGVPTIQHFGDDFYAHGVVFLEPGSRRGAVLLVNANGVPALVAAFPPIEAGVARLLAGQEPAPDAGLSLPRLYLVLDAALAVLLVAALWPLVRLRRWARRLAEDRRAGRRRRLRTALRVTAEVAGPLAVLGAARLALRRLGAQSWAEGRGLFPDTGAWLWTVCSAVALTGVARAVVALRAARTRPRAGARAAAPGAPPRQVPRTVARGG